MTKRGRGRPPKNDDESTQDRLLDAATAEFIERGFESATVSSIAARVGVTPAAIYNHFDSKESLLYLAGRRALDQLVTTMSSTARTPSELADLAELYLQPGMTAARHLLLELHMASIRHSELAESLAQWHRDVAEQLDAAGLLGETDPLATAKALFLLLLGLCHLEQLGGLDVAPAALKTQVSSMVAALLSHH